MCFLTSFSLQRSNTYLKSKRSSLSRRFIVNLSFSPSRLDLLLAYSYILFPFQKLHRLVQLRLNVPSIHPLSFRFLIFFFFLQLHMIDHHHLYHFSSGSHVRPSPDCLIFIGLVSFPAFESRSCLILVSFRLFLFPPPAQN